MRMFHMLKEGTSRQVSSVGHLSAWNSLTRRVDGRRSGNVRGEAALRVRWGPVGATLRAYSEAVISVQMIVSELA